MAQNPKLLFGWKQLKQSPVTSTLGIGIIVAATASPFLRSNITWADTAVADCVGILLLLAPDTLVKKFQSFLGR
jgi:hypothetical protein